MISVRALRRCAAAAVLSAVALVAAGCGSSGPMSTDAATITNLGDGADTVHITREDFQGMLDDMVDNDVFVKQLADSQLVVSEQQMDPRVTTFLLTQLIQQAAYAAEYEARDATVTEQNRADARSTLEQQFGGAEIFGGFSESFQNEMIEGTAKALAVVDSYATTPTEAEARAYFEEHQDEFTCASGKNVAHILVADEATANDLMTQLQGGASFEDLATQFSTDQGSAQQGGSLGCLGDTPFVEEFQTAADAATPGVPVGPVQSQFGYHIILVTDADDVTFEDVQDQVMDTLSQQGSQLAGEAFDKRLARMKVKVDPRYGTWGPAQNSQGDEILRVNPPQAPEVRDQREASTTTLPGLDFGQAP
jgi:parvulin-like peptidyl-prolyl isomerase